jgi:glutamate N-acetyltransferase/amino-acid N-acetyltransferase
MWQPVTQGRKGALQVLINAGQANAATGDAGYQDCLESADAVAKALDISADEVLLLSTGVIGRRIKLDALKEAVPKLAALLGSSVEDASHAAVAITTTDLVSKSAALEVEALHLHISAICASCFCWPSAICIVV